MTPSVRPSPSAPVREVLRLAFPAAVGLVSYAVMQAVDCAFLGHYDTVAQAGAGLTFVLVWSLMCPVIGTMTGVATITAQYFGGGRFRRAGEHLRSALSAGLLGALPLSALAFLAPALVSLADAEPRVATAGASYLKLRLLATPCVALAIGSASFFRGTGDAVTPLKVSVAANGLNLVLDYVLIFGRLGLPPLGVRGAALATVAAQTFEAATYLYLFARSRRLRRDFGLRLLGPIRREEVRRLVRIGGPIGLYWLADSGAWALFLALLGRFQDPHVVAANYAAFQVLHFSFLPVVGLLIAAQALVGQYLGRGDPATARRRAFLCMRLGVAYMVATGILILLLRFRLVRLFSPDPEVMALGAEVLLFIAILQPFDAVAMTAVGALRGAGDTLFALVTMAVLAWGLFVPGSYLIAFPLGGGPVGAWSAPVAYLALLGAVATVRLRSNRWAARVV